MGWMPGDNGWASCTMAGGPVDGVTYGEVPIGKDGEVPARMFIAAENVEQLFAVYDRQSSSPEGTWLFVFVSEYSGDPSEFPSIPVDMPPGSVVQFPADLAGPALDEEASEDDVEPNVESPREPAQRFVIEQSWWIAAELCRRHPSRRIYEWHPGGGQYDMLRIWGVGGVGAKPDSVFCDLNRNGTIHLPEDARLTWPDVFAADSAHEIVKRIEDASGKQLHRRAPATTATTLTYRVASLLLTTKLNDRATWDIRMEFGDSSGGAGSDYLNYVQQFPSAKRAFDTAGERRTAYDVGEHFWGVLRDQECVGVLDDAGFFHAEAGPIDLMFVYKRRRRLEDVVTAVMDAITT